MEEDYDEHTQQENEDFKHFVNDKFKTGPPVMKISDLLSSFKKDHANPHAMQVQYIIGL